MLSIRKGFTLVEILIVLALIGLFAAATSYLTRDSRIAQKNATRLADNINTTFRTAKSNMVLGKGVSSGSTLATTDKRVISIGSTGIKTTYGTTNTGTESNLPYPFYDGDANYKITDISVSSGILVNGHMPNWDQTGVTAADIIILKDGTIDITATSVPTKINAIRITAGYEGFEQSVMIDRIMGRSEVVEGKGLQTFVTTPASITAWTACSNGNQTRTCTEQSGGDPVTCATFGAISGLNSQSCGTPGACNNLVQFSCSAGTPTSQVTNSCSQNSTWGCNSDDGGVNTTATACSFANPVCIPGTCSASFNTYTTPTAICATGNPTAISGTGPWTWGCNSPNGGTNTTGNACSANKSIDCIGSWSACSLGSQTYTVSTPVANGGVACIANNGATQACGTPAVCSATFNAYTTPTAICATGNPTAISGTGPWTWGCNSPNGGTNTTGNACSANKSIDCIGSWSACSLGSQTYIVSTPAANGGLACSSTNGVTQGCGTPAVCSATFNAYPTPAPTCATGTPTAISGTGPWTWGCNSSNGGTNTPGNACSANKKVDCVGSWGACSLGSQTYIVSTPAANGGLACSSTNGATQGCGTPAVCNNATQFTCTSGNPVSTVANSCGQNATWGCNSIDGGTNTTATACSKANAACPINGACNNATQYACSAGTSASNVAGSCGGNSTWSCLGANGGTNATTCSKANAACPINGVCNNATQYACSAGTSASNVAGSCGGNSTWSCNGLNGGTNATTCSKANPSCFTCPSGYIAINSGLNTGICITPLRGPLSYQTAWDDCISVGASIAGGNASGQGIFSNICSISGGCGPLSPTSKIAWWGSNSRDWYNVRACDTAGCHTGWGTAQVSLYPYWDGVTPPPLGGILPYAPGDVADGTHYYWCEVPASSTYSWSSGAWGTCSLTCGGGTQTRAVTCLRNDGVLVADGNCNIATKPALSQSCNTQACLYTSCKGTPTTYSPAVAGSYTQAQGDTACVTAWGSGYKWADFMLIGQPNASQIFFNNLYINWANSQAPRPARCTTIWGGIDMYFMMLPGGWIWSMGYPAATNIFDPNYSGGSTGPTVPAYFCSSGTPVTIPLMCCK